MVNKPPQPIEAESSFGFLLHDVTRLIRANFNKRTQNLGLTQAQYRAILHLSRCEGVQQVALAEILDIQPITLARLLDKLEKAELIERRRDPTDRRAFQLYLTAQAYPLLEQIWQLAAETRQDAVADISPDELKQFFQTLQKLKNNLNPPENAPSPAITGITPVGETA